MRSRSGFAPMASGVALRTMVAPSCLPASRRAASVSGGGSRVVSTTSGLDPVDGGPGLLGGERHRRARDVGDAVLTGLLFDDDQRDPGGGGRAACDGLGVDPFGVQIGATLAAEIVVAERAEHGRRRTGAGGGDGLVGAFAAAEDGEGRAGHRLAGLGRFGDAGHQVGIDGAGDEDLTGAVTAVPGHDLPARRRSRSDPMAIPRRSRQASRAARKASPSGRRPA